MTVPYDQLVAGNCFGGIDVTTPMISKVENHLKNSSNEKLLSDRKTISAFSKEFDLPLNQLFDEARRFLKEQQQNPKVQITYDENLRFVALLKQSKFGPWNSSFSSELGFLNVVGNDRKRAWIALGDISKESAMEEFIKSVFARFTTFEEHLKQRQENIRQKKDDDIRRVLENEQILHLARIEEQRKKYEEFQRRQIQLALNQQTYSQFKAYAEQHYKDNPQAQEELIRQLQEEHFQQYLKQVYQQQIRQQQEQQRRAIKMEQQQQQMTPPENIVPQAQTPTGQTFQAELAPLGPAPSELPPIVNPPPPPVLIPNETTGPIQNQFETLSLTTPLTPIDGLSPSSTPSVEIRNETSNAVNPVENSIPMANVNGLDSNSAENQPTIVLANMWTRKDLKEFKDQLRKEKDAVIKVGSGETVTVRVPTHEEGQCIFWEFATDYYDLGFGVYFEWSKSPSNTVTVHVSDSSEDEEDAEDGTNPEKKDVEKGGSASTNKPNKPRQDEIVPICRRDSHEEIYAGSHRYPGEGVYLLKFDNSYSLWRSKTLYYRVYYSK